MIATAEKLVVKRGQYLTDGRRLVMIRKVEKEQVLVEEDKPGCAVDDPVVTALTRTEIMAKWRVVKRGA